MKHTKENHVKISNIFYFFFYSFSLFDVLQFNIFLSPMHAVFALNVIYIWNFANVQQNTHHVSPHLQMIQCYWIYFDIKMHIFELKDCQAETQLVRCRKEQRCVCVCASMQNASHAHFHLNHCFRVFLFFFASFAFFLHLPRSHQQTKHPKLVSLTVLFDATEATALHIHSLLPLHFFTI